MNYINYLLIAALSFLILGCASFSKKEFKQQSSSISKHNLAELNGNYSYFPLQQFRKNLAITKPDSLKNINLYHTIINKNWYQPKDSSFNKEATYTINIQAIETKKIAVSLLKNGLSISDTVFSGKVRNGMFVLHNKLLDCYGIPYLFGGCKHHKIRIGLSKKNNLITNQAICDEGAFLLLMGAGVNYNSSYEFERIK